MSVIVSKHAEERMEQRGVRLGDFKASVEKMAEKPGLSGDFNIIVHARGGKLSVSVAKGPKGIVVKTVAWDKRPRR